ncbi:MAG: EamA family transporter RarD [Thermodesulfobacteriota bacterium]
MNPERRLTSGYLLALAAFTWWGLFPFYFKAVAAASPVEVLAHRVVWSVPVCALILTVLGGWSGLARAMARPKVLGTLGLTAAIIGTNWLIFIYAVLTDRLLAASLGYFITPLVNLAMGMIFLGERPGRWQLVAMVLAGLGTLNLVVSLGNLPWISLSLALSLACYGLLRKTVQGVEAVGGLLVETSLLTPLALAWFFWAERQGSLAFGHQGLWLDLLLLSAGWISSLPLIWFTAGARRIPFYGLGLCQYVSPSLQFLLAVALYHEPFTRTHLITFSLVWAGLALSLLAGSPWFRRRSAL